MSDDQNQLADGRNEEEEVVDVLYLAGQRVTRGWWLVAAVDGKPGGDFTAQQVSTAHGGDVLLHVAPAADAAPGPPAAEVSVFAVLAGRLVPVASWRSLEPEAWPEVTRPCAAFAMSMFTELEEHGGNLGARQPVDLDVAMADAGADIPLRITFGSAAPQR